MAKAKQQADGSSKVAKPLEKFEKKYDLTKRVKAEKPYSWLKHTLDTRVDGAANADFVEELMANFKDTDAALDELLKYPIEATGDGVIVVGRALAKAIANILVTPTDPDPEIPVEIYDEISNYDRLSEEDQAGLRLYAVKRDMTKNKQRGLLQEDKLYNARHLVSLGWSKDRVIAGLIETGITLWKAEELYRTAKNSFTNSALSAARKEVEDLRKAKKPINVDKICVAHGLDPQKYGKQILTPTTRGGRPAALNALIKKQKWTQRKNSPQVIADTNIDWYRRSVQGTLEEGERPLSGDVFVKLTRQHFNEAVSFMNFWKDALDRAEAEVNRLEAIRKNNALIARLKKNSGQDEE